MPFRTFQGQPNPRIIVHATTAPTVDNICPVGTIWIQTAGVGLFVSTGNGVWTPIT